MKKKKVIWMWIVLVIAGILAVVLIGSCAALNVLNNVETLGYEVVEKEGDFQIRRYDPYIEAYTEVDAGFQESGNVAFGRLFDYISGKNRSQEKIAMTAPVNQQQEGGKTGEKIPMTAPVIQKQGEDAGGEKIAMTAPVNQTQSEGVYEVSFVMPTKFTMENIPVPEDERVKLRKVDGGLFAAVRYSGSWGQDKYTEMLEKLREFVDQQGYRVTGEDIFARYNAPFTPGFMRRNEVLLPIEPAQSE